MSMTYWGDVFQNLKKMSASKSFKTNKPNIPVVGSESPDLWDGSMVIKEKNAVLINNSNEANDGLLVSCMESSVLRLATLLSQKDSEIVKAPSTSMSSKILSASKVSGTDDIKMIEKSVDSVSSTTDGVDTVLAEVDDSEDDYDQVNVSELLSPKLNEESTIQGLFTNGSEVRWSNAFAFSGTTCPQRESFVMSSPRLSAKSLHRFSTAFQSAHLEDDFIDQPCTYQEIKRVEEIVRKSITMNANAKGLSDTESVISTSSAKSLPAVSDSYSPSKIVTMVPFVSEYKEKVPSDLLITSSVKTNAAKSRAAHGSKESSRRSKRITSSDKRNDQKTKKIDISYVAGQRTVRGYTIQKDHFLGFVARSNFSI